MIYIYTVRDAAAEKYLIPFFSQTDGMAVRDFTSIVTDENHQFHKFSEHFALYKIGEYLEETGLIDVAKAPELIVEAAAILRKPKEENSDA